MLKQVLFIVLLTIVGKIVLAQPVLNAANFNPHPGELFIISNCDTTGVLPGPAGANVTWAFDALSTTSMDTSSTDTCIMVPHCSMFPGSTIGFLTFSGSTYNYIIADESGLYQNGYYGSPTQYLIFSDPIRQLQYPFLYTSAFVDTFVGQLTYGSSTIRQSGVCHDTCDSWGTLILPGRTETGVLRVHSDQIYIDSANLFGTPVIDTFIFDSYVWYKPNYHSALLTINVTQQVGGSLTNKLVSFANDIPTTTTGKLESKYETISISPNPVDDIVKIHFTAINSNVKIVIMSRDGSFIRSVAEGFYDEPNDVELNLSGLNSGLYFVRMETNDAVINRKLIKL